jgi:hypothetical protein
MQGKRKEAVGIREQAKIGVGKEEEALPRLGNQN